MATYVLIHGGGHGGWCFKFVARHLRDAGQEVHAPTLPGLAEREDALSAEIDLHFHIAEIVKYLHFHDLREVILVGHSYGGMVITGAADRATDRVGHLVYLDAVTPKNGDSLIDCGVPILKAREHSRIVKGVELCLFPSKEAKSFYGVEDPELVEWMRERLTPHPWRCFDQPLRLSNQESLLRIPQSHIASRPSAIPRDVEHLRRVSQGRFWEIATGHDLMITEPRKVADLLLAVPDA